VDRQGTLYVSDHRSRRIVTFAPDGREVAAFGPELPAPYGSFGLTEGVAVDREGNIYVEDRSGPRVVKLSPQGTPLAQWQAPTGYVPEGTPGMDARGNLYLTLNADTQPSMVVTLSPDLRVRSRWN
jgi:sugar lactone lactonase YvrE